MPGWGLTIWRGMLGRCPRCGKAEIFAGYLTVQESCASCDAPLGEMPADDTPPFIAMVVVLHLLGLYAVLAFRLQLRPSMAENGVLLLLLIGLCLIALRMAKGAVIGILLKLDNNREKPNA